VYGPALGALVVVLLKNYASAFIERWNLMLGLVFIFIVVFMPGGLAAGLPWLRRRARQAEPAPPPAGPAQAGNQGLVAAAEPERAGGGA
jgi:hypothetical protein